MPSYKLTYFDVRGRGELTRCLFAAAGVKFEDQRLTREQWHVIKPSTPFGQIPVLEVDGKSLAQGGAIARYLARQFGLVGEDNFEQALCDQFIELGTGDVYKEVRAVYFERDENKKIEMGKRLSTEELPKFMSYFQKALDINGGTYLVGKGLSVADLACVCTFDTPLMMFPEAMDPFPTLKQHRERILALPKIQDYLKQRKQTGI